MTTMAFGLGKPSPGQKYQETRLFIGSDKPRMLFFLLINVKMPTICCSQQEANSRGQSRQEARDRGQSRCASNMTESHDRKRQLAD